MASSWVYLTLSVVAALIALGVVAINTALNQNILAGITPRISQEEALKIVEDDLRRHYSDFKQIGGIVMESMTYIPMSEFYSKEMKLPLIYIHPNATLIKIKGGERTVLYKCEQGVYPYCGFLSPFNLNSKGRLIYGLDIYWVSHSNDKIPDIYAVDAITGEVVDSSFLRSESRSKNAE